MRQYDAQDLLLVSRQFDKLKVYFSHLVDTLHFLDDNNKFAQLLPENAALSLAQDYKLQAPHVFQIMRCTLPPIYKQTPETFKAVANEFWGVLEANLRERIQIA